MDASRLFVAAYYADSENRALKIEELFRASIAALQQSIAAPADANIAQTFRDTQAKILNALSSAPSNLAPPTRQLIWNEIGATQNLGNGLLARINAILNGNRMTPQTAVTELTKLADDTKKYFTATASLLAAFQALGIESDDLEKGQNEIGFSFPKTLVANQLSALSHELDLMEKALRTFEEVSGDGVKSTTVKKISSSEWQFFLDSAPATATCLVIAIERIVHLYKSNLEIKKLKRDLEEKNFPEPIITMTQEYIDKKIKQEIQVIADNIVDEFYKTENKERKNELKVATRFALIYIADRIDKGTTVEVTSKPPDPPKEPAKKDVDAPDQEYVLALEEYNKRKVQADQINEKGRAIADMARIDQPILMLEADNPAPDDAKSQSVNVGKT